MGNCRAGGGGGPEDPAYLSKFKHKSTVKRLLLAHKREREQQQQQKCPINTLYSIIPASSLDSVFSAVYAPLHFPISSRRGRGRGAETRPDGHASASTDARASERRRTSHNVRRASGLDLFIRGEKGQRRSPMGSSHFHLGRVFDQIPNSLPLSLPACLSVCLSRSFSFV